METEQALKNIVKGGGIALIAIFFGKVLGYLYILVATRLGPELYGLLSLGITMLVFLSAFASFGMESGILRYSAFYRAKDDKARIKGVLNFAFVIALPISILISIITFLFADQISIFFFSNKNFSQVLRIFSLAIPFSVFANFFLTFIRSFQKVKYEMGVRDIGERSIRILLTLFFIFLGFGLFGASIAYLISTVLMFFLALYFSNKIFPLINKIKPKYINKELLLYSLPLFFTLFLSTLFSRIDTLMLAYFKDAFLVGLYNVAFPLSAVVVIIPTAIIVIFLPVITGFYAKKQIKKAREIYSVVSKWSLMASFPIFLLLIFFSRQIIDILFTKEYATASSALVILAFGHLFFSLGFTSQNVVNSIGKTKIVLYSTLTLVVLNIILNYFLIPPFGINGAALATSISFSLASFITIFFVIKIFKAKPFNKKSLLIIFSGLASLLLVYLINYYILIPINIERMIRVVILTIIFFLSYLLSLKLTKTLEKQDKMIILTIFSKAKLVTNKVYNNKSRSQP